MKPTENIAVIDIGSNTLRLLIGNILNNKINKLYSDRVVTRLGENLTKNSFINIESIKTSIDSLKKFKKLSEKFNVSYIIAVGTSALREAKNSKYFCELVKTSTGIKINIISGEEEAYYTISGLMDEEFRKETCFIVDIGGGSTEYVYWKHQELKTGSLFIGALKIKEKFFVEDPPPRNAIFQAKNYIEKIIRTISFQSRIDKFIATGGTASTLAMINLGLSRYCPEQTHMSVIYTSKLQQLLEKLLSLSLEERTKIGGVPDERADIICAGLLILNVIVCYLNIDKLFISENGMLEGIMKNYKNFCYNIQL
ncbi:MAG TPA: hypothetical protein PKZ17_03445 [Thermodesulfovibrio thiophilus]|nr:hypothetical protein [Thermodesulfovibrio thiophilus]HQA03777.1 hypothetical protein [Thermodesulfovibrio thiophilus]HQD36376.1 hypothetical protein [Thermodesulfovibrio thiophilus]